MGAPMAPWELQNACSQGDSLLCPQREADPRRGWQWRHGDGHQPHSGRPERAPKVLHPAAQPRPCSTRTGRAVGQGRHTCEECRGSLSTCPRGSHTDPPTAQHPWVSIRIPQCRHRRVVMPTRPLSTFPCLSFPRVPTQTPCPAVGSQVPEQPLAPSPHTGAAAARPRRRHVLSPVECAKSLPDVHGGQPDPPPLPPGWPPGTPEHNPTGLSPSTRQSLPNHGAQPCVSFGVVAPRPSSALAARRAGQQRVPGRGRRCHKDRVAVSPWHRGPADRARRGRTGSCPAPPAPVPGGSSRAERGCQMESGCRR